MTFRMLYLGETAAGVDRYKCFYGTDGANYGEFYLEINTVTLEAEVVAKEATYAEALIGAFAAALRSE